MIILDNRRTSKKLPVYEVQEVTVKEALALLKSDQKNDPDSLIVRVGSRIGLSGDSFAGRQGVTNS